MRKAILLIFAMAGIGLSACAVAPTSVTMSLPSDTLLFTPLQPLPDHTKDTLGVALLKERASNLDTRARYTNAWSAYRNLRSTYIGSKGR